MFQRSIGAVSKSTHGERWQMMSTLALIYIYADDETVNLCLIAVDNGGERLRAAMQYWTRFREQHEHYIP